VVRSGRALQQAEGAGRGELNGQHPPGQARPGREVGRALGADEGEHGLRGRHRGGEVGADRGRPVDPQVGQQLEPGRAAGAHVRRLPNIDRTAEVASTTPEPNGSGAPGPSTSRFAAGKPCRTRTAHMTGSHDTIAPALTSLATHAAAWSRTPLASVSEADAAGWSGRSVLITGEVRWEVEKPLAASTARKAAVNPATETRPMRRSACGYGGRVRDRGPGWTSPGPNRSRS
jgi:hypothetical protein